MFIQVGLIALLAGMSPGPDFFLIMKNSLGYGRKIGLASAVGVAAALSIHATYTILGIALIIRHYRFIYVFIQLTGALYLAYLGIRTFIATFRTIGLELEAERDIHKGKSLFSGFMNGFLCNLLNPKAFVFFLSIFSQFITPGMPVWMEWVYGLEAVVAIGAWFAGLSFLVSSEKFRTMYRRFEKWFERVFGALLVFFAVKVFKSALE